MGRPRLRVLLLVISGGAVPGVPLMDTLGVTSLSHEAAPTGIIFQTETKYSSRVLYLVRHDLLSYYKY